MTYRRPNFKGLYLSEIINNWFGRPSADIPISINASKIEYRMTLGSVYYDLDSRNLKTSIKSPTTPVEEQAWLYLQRYFPKIYNMCLSVRSQTRIHLTEIKKMLIQYVFTPVQKTVNELKVKYPQLKEYSESERPRSNYFVFQNITESVYQEIQHYSILGNRLDFFKIDQSGSRIGNGYTYMVSSNPELLSEFLDRVTKVISNPDALQSFRDATGVKSKIETQVFTLEKNLKNLLSDH